MHLGLRDLLLKLLVKVSHSLLPNIEHQRMNTHRTQAHQERSKQPQSYPQLVFPPLILQPVQAQCKSVHLPKSLQCSKIHTQSRQLHLLSYTQFWINSGDSCQLHQFFWRTSRRDRCSSPCIPLFDLSKLLDQRVHLCWQIHWFERTGQCTGHLRSGPTWKWGSCLSRALLRDQGSCRGFVLLLKGWTADYMVQVLFHLRHEQDR